MPEADRNLTAKAAFLWIWQKYLRFHKGVFAIALFAMAIEGAMLGLMSYMMKPMFDDIFISAQSAMIYVIGGIFLGIFCIRAVSAVSQKWFLAQGVERVSAKLRQDVFGHVLALDGDFHRKMPVGYLIQRIEGDVAQLKLILASVIRGYGRDVIALVALTTVALTIDWVWTLVACIGVPALVAPTAFVQRYVRRHAKAARETAAELSHHISESLTAIDEVKLNTIEAYQTQRYSNLNTKAIRMETRAAFGQALLPGMVDVMAGVAFMAVLVYGATEIINGQKTVGDFVAFFTALGLAFDPLRRLGALSGQWQIGITIVERLSEILNTQSVIKPASAPIAPAQGAVGVTFSQVNVSYGDKTILNNLSFRAKPGQLTAIVGPSGAGKTTVFKALGRLVEPLSGKIQLGDHDIRRYRVEDLRSMLSIVGQEALLFDETLIDNLCFDREISQEKLQNALRDAHIDAFADDLPNGVETRLGIRGSALSGGQRQRVAIARALLRDTPVLLLDEATSALDAKSESVVQEALNRLSHGRTTLIIAHRLATVRHADHILVLNEGQLTEEGTHDALLEKGGLYAQLIKMQFNPSD